MNRPSSRQHDETRLTAWVLTVIICMAAVGITHASERVGSFTLLTGTPRIAGKAIEPLQPILSGVRSKLTTGKNDAVGLVVSGVVVHVDHNAEVNVREKDGVVEIEVKEGRVALYGGGNAMKAKTSLAEFIAPSQEDCEQSGSRWYIIRHDPERANEPAVSTFTAIEGTASVLANSLPASPLNLLEGRTWRIEADEPPVDLKLGDELSAAEALRETLHRDSSVVMRQATKDDDRLASADVPTTPRIDPPDGEGQNVFTVDDLASLPSLVILPPLVPDPPGRPPPIDPLISGAMTVPAGSPTTGLAHFVAPRFDDPTTPIPVWIDFLTSVNGSAGFQPKYLRRLENGGFSYIQTVGTNVLASGENDELFFVRSDLGPSGWAFFTPQTAIADRPEGPDPGLTKVITDGFEAIRDNGGTIGDFAVSSSVGVELNPNLPVGYPALDQADTPGFDFGSDQGRRSHQIAALGAGLNPVDLSPGTSRLLFISTSNEDANRLRVDFRGTELKPTELTLPSDREPLFDRGGLAGVAVPLSNSGENTVGIQFAGSGDIVAIIHHGGSRSADGDTSSTPEDPKNPPRFEVQRFERYSTVSWIDEARVAGPDGQQLEFADLDESQTEIRDELFLFMCEEVNALVPRDKYTVCGPATESADQAGHVENRVTVLRRSTRLMHRVVQNRSLARHRPISTKRDLASRRLGRLRAAPGALVRPGNSTRMRRYIGRATDR